MQQINLKKQTGFSILAVILVIVAVIVAIGVWALSGQTNTSNLGNSTSDIQAASIINDSSSMKLAFDSLIVNGYSASSIVFLPNTASTGTAPNMLEPTNGVQVPKPNTKAIKAGSIAPEGIWVYNPTGFKLVSLGGSTAAEQILLLAGVKKDVCERINNTLHGSTTIPNVALTATSDAFVTGATESSPTSTKLISIS